MWKPIDTIPKDGTPVLVVKYGRSDTLGIPFIPQVAVCRKDGDIFRYEQFYDDFTKITKPDYWMEIIPTPAPNTPTKVEPIMTGWQPIETAPKSEGLILAVGVTEHGLVGPVIVTWWKDKWSVDDTTTEIEYDLSKLTHWLEIPDYPEYVYQDESTPNVDTLRDRIIKRIMDDPTILDRLVESFKDEIVD